MHLFDTKLFYSTLISIVVLNGCGGSGSDNTTSTAAPEISTPAPTILQGVFLDSAVEGLAYATATQSGTTNVQGQFSYIAGEEVVFSIGDIQFPAVAGQEMISPLDVFSVTTTDDTRVSNMARLLQTLDEDGMPGNGITITDQAHNQATGVVVGFASDDFEQQVLDVVANSGAVYTSLISAQSAIDHLNLTLGNMAAVSRSCADNNLKPGYTGTFSTLAYEVAGRVTVINNCSLEVTMFTYVDGGAPGVSLYAGINGVFTGPDAFGFGPRFDGRTLRNETLIVTLPPGKTVADFDSLSVWCFDFDANFGSLRLEAP